MAHTSGFDLTHFTNGAHDRFGRQFAHLARDARHLSDALSRHADGHHGIGHLAHNFSDGAMHGGAVAARVIGKQAWKAGSAIRQDPLPTVAAVVGLACLLSLAMSSASRR